MEINEFYSAPKSEKIATFEMSTLIAKHFEIPFNGFKRLNSNVDSFTRVEHDEASVEVINLTHY